MQLLQRLLLQLYLKQLRLPVGQRLARALVPVLEVCLQSYSCQCWVHQLPKQACQCRLLLWQCPCRRRLRLE